MILPELFYAAPEAPISRFGVPGNSLRKLRGADLFCGGGGTTEGIEMALREIGRQATICCVNHNPAAIDTHSTNHPLHRHLCTGIDDVTPEKIFAGEGLDFFSASPSCVYFTAARTGKPLNPQERDHPWQVVKWIRRTHPDFFFVENVPPFLKWCPCIQRVDAKGRPVFLREVKVGKKTRYVVADGPNDIFRRPKGVNIQTWWAAMAKKGLHPYLEADKKRLGQAFRKWIDHIRKAGYLVEWRVLNAADYGAATSRPRLFVQAVRVGSGKQMCWPNPTHCQPDANGNVPDGMLPWRITEEVIDASDRGAPILGRKKPLAKNSLRRIAYGLLRYAIPELVAKLPGKHTSASVMIKLKGTGTAKSIRLPLDTIAAQGRHHALLTVGASRLKNSTKREGNRVAQMTTKKAETLVEAFLVQAAHGNDTDRVEENFRRVKSLKGTMGAVTGSRDWAICSAFIVPNFGERVGQAPRTHRVDAPLPAVTSHGAGGLVTVNLAGAIGDDEMDLVLQVGRMNYRLELRYRMVRPDELALAQSFPKNYCFKGNKGEVVKQIGNSVAPLMARALFKAALTGNPKVGVFTEPAPLPAAA